MKAKKLLTNDKPRNTDIKNIKPIYFSLKLGNHNLWQIKIVLINKAVPCKILTKKTC